MEVVWLPTAFKNLQEIKKYIESESPRSAKMVATQIKKRFLSFKKIHTLGSLLLLVDLGKFKYQNCLLSYHTK